MSKTLNLTRLWHKAHSHLQPFTEHLALADDTSFTCPICTKNNAFKLKVQVRFGEQDWESAEPIYCPGCSEYSLLDVPTHKEPLTTVDARLWSAEPTFLNIEPTTRCNFNCWYCVGRHMQQEDIKVENFAQVLDNFPTVKTIALVGEGEPLMHKGFFDMAHMAKERNVRVMIISNGSTLSTSIVKQLCESEVAYIGISIDSIDPKVFASSRIDGKLEQIWQGIQRLREYRDAHGYQYPKIGLKGTLFSYNKTELPDIVETAKSYGVEIFESFQALNPMSTYIPIYPEQSLSEVAHIDEVANIINQDSVQATQQLQPFAEFCATEGIEIDKNGTANNIRNNCDEQWIYSLLSGDITPCCQIKTPISDTWNLFKHTLPDILSDHQYENTRFNLWNGIFPTYCDGCWKTR
ncbi:MAG: AdoMet-dependent heme synthase (plasmid) [Methyloprofundus sp.]|nr:MAG: AdoMet-dependent heme synthase [Methyloprofundus sp.]